MSHDAIRDDTNEQKASRHTPRSAAPSNGDFLSAISNDLSRFNASLELFCRKLGRVLPDISREINNTYHKASQTMDSLISEDPVGPIEITVSALDVSLARIDKHLRERKTAETLVSKDLETLWAGLPTARASIQDFQKRHDEFAASYPPGGPAGLHLRADGMSERARAMAGIIHELETSKVRLSENIEASAILHAGIVSAVEMHTAMDVNALKDTLGSIIVILKDLISRSTATKGPIQAIMTALQIHDIVRQDIENILKVLERLRDLPQDAGLPGTPVHGHHAWAVCGGLLSDISAIVHDHVQTVARHIQCIHEIVAGVRTDKIHLAELLLINTQGSSTLDRALAEIVAMFQDLSERLGRLASLGKQRHEMLLTVRGLIDELHHGAHAFDQDIRSMDEASTAYGSNRIAALLEAGRNLHSAVAALKTPSVQTVTAADIQVRDAAEECIALIQEDTEALRGSLLEIKRLLVDSIDGINDYANRCMLAVLRFQHRMQRLNLFVARLPDIAVTMKSPVDSPAETPWDAEIQDPELKALLMALQHPHIKTLHRSEAQANAGQTDEDDLTLF